MHCMQVQHSLFATSCFCCEPSNVQTIIPYADGDGKKGKEEKPEPEANFALSGKLAAESNTVNGVVLMHQEPPESRKPSQMWRLYGFKNGRCLLQLCWERFCLLFALCWDSYVSSVAPAVPLACLSVSRNGQCHFAAVLGTVCMYLALHWKPSDFFLLGPACLSEVCQISSLLSCLHSHIDSPPIRLMSTLCPCWLDACLSKLSLFPCCQPDCPLSPTCQESCLSWLYLQRHAITAL